MELNYPEEALILFIRNRGWSVTEVLNIIEDAHSSAQTDAPEEEPDSKVGWPVRWTSGDGPSVQRWIT